MIFKKGFYYKKFFYGWYKKELYKLPTNNNYCTTLKKLSIIKVGNKEGYRIANDKKTIAQCVAITTTINKKVEVIIDNDVPF